jgi:hypothetical protein
MCNAFGVTTYLGNTVLTDDLLFPGIVLAVAALQLAIPVAASGPLLAYAQLWPGRCVAEWTGRPSNRKKENDMTIGTILLIILILLLIGALPTWPHSRSWGYYPSGGLGLILIIVIILLLTGTI